jgi:hypothetical protein
LVSRRSGDDFVVVLRMWRRDFTGNNCPRRYASPDIDFFAGCDSVGCAYG